MRLGLRGQLRRVWAPRGVKVRQPLELTYEWRYLALAVDGPGGRLSWCWLPNMKQEAVAAAIGHWRADGLAAAVWDGASSHRARLVREQARAQGLALVGLPPASPELNPAERVFEVLRGAVEGRVYGTLDAKMAAVERELATLAAQPERVRHLAGWDWISDALAALPSPFMALS
jgi:transposase